LAHRFLNKFAAKVINVSHLTWIMSLHYLVNLKCSSDTYYGWVVKLVKEETPEFIPPQLWPSNLPDLNPIDSGEVGVEVW